MSSKDIAVLPRITDNQAKFVTLYLETPILKYCAEQLGTSLSTLYTWLKRKNVNTHLQHYRAKIAEKCPFTLEQVANEAGRIAFYDVKQHIKAINQDPSATNDSFLMSYKDLDKLDGRALKNVKEKLVDGVPMVVVEPYEKDKFLRILADILKSQDPEKHVHVHLSAEDLAKRDIHGAAQAYQELMD